MVLHDLRSQRVDYIANNLSKREVGDDSALEDMLEGDSDERNIGPYEKLNWDGQKIRSVSTVLLDAAGQPLAVLCINLNISLFESAKAALDLFLAEQADPATGRAVPRRLAGAHQHLPARLAAAAPARLEPADPRAQARTGPGPARRGRVQGKSAANYVANVLNMGRATVYKHLKELKEGGD